MLINTLVVEARGFRLLKKVLCNCSVSWLSSALKARDELTGDVVPILGVVIRVPIPGFTLAPKSPAVTLIATPRPPAAASIAAPVVGDGHLDLSGSSTRRFEYRILDFWKSVL